MAYIYIGMGDDISSILSEHLPADLLHYRIDGQDRIIHVDHSWNDFADRNGGSSIAAVSILGKPISQYIEGAEARLIYGMLYRRAREQRIEVMFSFRCDSPTLRRFMRLIIQPASEGHLDFFSLTLREEARSYVPLLDAGMPRLDEFIIMCSWCKRVQVATGNWCEVEAAVTALDLFNMDHTMPRISHHICPDCKEHLLQLSGGTA